MSNVDIRTMILQNGLKHYEVANEIGVSDSTFCRRLRSELPQKQKKEIIEAIERIKARA